MYVKLPDPNENLKGIPHERPQRNAYPNKKEWFQLSQNEVLFFAKEALLTAVMVGGPILGISLVVGLVVSIFQAMTQIQEQTLTFIPKIIAIIAVMLFLGPWMLGVLTQYTANIFTELPNFAKY